MTYFTSLRMATAVVDEGLSSASSSSSYVVISLEVVTTLFVVDTLLFLEDTCFDDLRDSTVELSVVDVNHPLFSFSFGTSLLKSLFLKKFYKKRKKCYK